MVWWMEHKHVVRAYNEGEEGDNNNDCQRYEHPLLG